MKLNWKDHLQNENLLTDALKFRDWDQKNLNIPERETLIKDLTRTRNDDPFFKKESTQRKLMLLATFYCQQNNVNYQQGMLEVVVPFLLLKSNEFPLERCYAYFNSFMNQYFPKVLESNLLGGNKELAHVLSSIRFCDILLKYHCANFYNSLLKMDEFNISMVVTPLIMTLFAKGTPISIVYLIFEEFMKRHNPNYLFFLVSATFEKQKTDILAFEGCEELFQYLNKGLNKLYTQDDVYKLFNIADQQYSQTPNSFEQLIKIRTSFHDNSGVLSIEEIGELTNFEKSLYSRCLIIESSEVRAQLGISQTILPHQLKLFLIDIRKQKKPKLKDYISQKFIVKQPKNDQNHYTLIIDSKEHLSEAINIAEQWIKEGFNHISIMKGGFKELQHYIKPKQECLIM